MQHRTKARIAAAVGTAMALVSQSPAAAVTTVDGWQLHSSAQTTTQLSATSTVKPLVGDFNGDHRSDVLFYAPGSAADVLWTSQPYVEGGSAASRFTATTMSISGTYTPVVGDFDGNGASDILWYVPGTGADSMWYFEDGHISSTASKTINGQYTPVVANFDHVDPVTDTKAAKDDIFWYSATGSSTLWSGVGNRTFTTRTYTTQPPQNAKVLVGNFTVDPEHTDGTYDVDMLFYSAGSGADAVWSGTGTGAFSSIAKTINGTYVPVVGEFDRVDQLPAQGQLPGAELTDVLWYAPGTAMDSVWMNSESGFTTSPLTINAAGYRPFVIPNVLGGDTIMWNNPTGADFRWQPRGTTAFDYAALSWPGSDMAARTPLLGLFDDDAARMSDIGVSGVDVLWAQAGNTAAQTEVLWSGYDPGAWILVPPVAI